MPQSPGLQSQKPSLPAQPFPACFRYLFVPAIPEQECTNLPGVLTQQGKGRRWNRSLLCKTDLDETTRRPRDTQLKTRTLIFFSSGEQGTQSLPPVKKRRRQHFRFRQREGGRGVSCSYSLLRSLVPIVAINGHPMGLGKNGRAGVQP